MTKETRRLKKDGREMRGGQSFKQWAETIGRRGADWRARKRKARGKGA